MDARGVPPRHLAGAVLLLVPGAISIVFGVPRAFFESRDLPGHVFWMIAAMTFAIGALKVVGGALVLARVSWGRFVAAGIALCLGGYSVLAPLYSLARASDGVRHLVAQHLLESFASSAILFISAALLLLPSVKRVPAEPQPE